jgi:hypothetical protein
MSPGNAVVRAEKSGQRCNTGRADKKDADPAADESLCEDTGRRIVRHRRLKSRHLATYYGALP